MTNTKKEITTKFINKIIDYKFAPARVCHSSSQLSVCDSLSYKIILFYYNELYKFQNTLLSFAEKGGG